MSGTIGMVSNISNSKQQTLPKRITVHSLFGNDRSDSGFIIPYQSKRKIVLKFKMGIEV